MKESPFYAVFDGEVQYQIQDAVPLPKSKTKAAKERDQRKAFNAYRDAYEKVHVYRPKLIEVTDAGFFRIDTIGSGVSKKRLQELTNMLKLRAKS